MKVIDLRSYGNQVTAVMRDEEGNIKWDSFDYEWYFYIRMKDVDKALRTLPPNVITKIEEGRHYAKVFGNYWDFRKGWLLSLRDAGVETFEGDLDLADRYRYDHIRDFEIDDRVDILYIDIETDDRTRLIEIGRDYILSFAAIDRKGNKYFEILEKMSPEGEMDLFNRINKIIKRYQVVAGWNINNFDIPYLRSRMQRYEMKLPWTGRYDMFERCKHIYRFDSTIKSFSLENVSQLFLGRGKVKHDQGIFEMWWDNPELLKIYNEEDTQLCHDLDTVMNMCGMMILQSKWCKVPPRKFSLYQLIDSVIIQKSHKLGRPVPTNYNALRSFDDPSLEDEFEKYMGAEVLDPQIGLHDNTYVFDFKSLYPSIMVSCNIGYDTMETENPTGEYITAPGPATVPRGQDLIVRPVYFRKDPSCIAETIKELIGLRNSYKKLKLKYIEEGKTDLLEYQTVVSDEIIVKELSNSVYGIMGMSYGRYYNVDVAESITLTGRWILQFAKTVFTSRGYNVIYGDTDSVFIQTDRELDLDFELDLFHVAIKDTLQRSFNVQESIIQLNFDKHYTRFILFAKKTYAGHCDNMEGKKTDKLYVRGVGYIKRNTFKWAATRQKQLLEDLLRRVINKEDVITRIRMYKQEFFSTTFTPDELKITQRVGKEKYSGGILIGRLAERKKELTGTHPIGTEIEYIITESKKTMKGCLLEDYNGRFSRTHYWENLSRPLFDTILDVVDPGKNIDYASLW